MGREIAPVTYEEKSMLWRDSMKHAKRQDGSITKKVFEQGYFGYTLLGGLLSSSDSDSESDSSVGSDSDFVFLYTTQESLHRKEIFLYSPPPWVRRREVKFIMSSSELEMETFSEDILRPVYRPEAC